MAADREDRARGERESRPDSRGVSLATWPRRWGYPPSGAGDAETRAWIKIRIWEDRERELKAEVERR